MVVMEIVFLDFVLGFLIVTIRFQIVGNQTQRKRNSQNAQRKAIDSAKLIEMVKEGTTRAEIMKKMGFKTSIHLKPLT